jgi:hypothetical protein
MRPEDKGNVKRGCFFLCVLEAMFEAKVGHVFEAKRAPDWFKVAFFRSLVFFFVRSLRFGFSIAWRISRVMRWTRYC